MNNLVIVGTLKERASQKYLIMNVKDNTEGSFDLRVFVPFADKIDDYLLKEGDLIAVKGHLISDTLYGIMVCADKCSFLSSHKEGVNNANS